MGIMLLEKIKSGKLGEESDSGCVVRVRNIRSIIGLVSMLKFWCCIRCLVSSKI